MAQQNSFDIVSEFDFQELRNAVDQTQKEINSRYDFKGIFVEINLEEDKIVVKTDSDFRLQAIRLILLNKLSGRKLDPRILDFKDPQAIFGGNVKQEIALIKVLDKDNAKKISKLIQGQFKNAKPSIQGEAVRVISKSKDELQEVITFLKSQEDLDIPLSFKNYR